MPDSMRTSTKRNPTKTSTNITQRASMTSWQCPLCWRNKLKSRVPFDLQSVQSIRCFILKVQKYKLHTSQKTIQMIYLQDIEEEQSTLLQLTVQLTVQWRPWWVNDKSVRDSEIKTFVIEYTIITVYLIIYFYTWYMHNNYILLCIVRVCVCVCVFVCVCAYVCVACVCVCVWLLKV